MRLALCIVPAAISFAIVPGAAARTWRITPDGVGADAPAIQAGIDSARSGDDVLLAPGTYTWGVQGGSRGSMLHLAPGITLHGEAGAAATILDAEGQGRILTCADVGAGAVIADLTFANGFSPRDADFPAAKSLNPDDTHGAAIDVRGASNPAIRHCVFRDNRASGGLSRGGAVFCDLATIEDCTFTDNQSGVSGPTDGHGGALWCGAATVRRCTFRRNHARGFEATSGGAIRSQSATILDCTFEDNSIECPGGPRGGAVCDTGLPLLERCTFRGNVAFGHYFSANAGGAYVGSGVVRDCLFVRNTATCLVAMGRGGALFGNEVTVVGCTFLGNLAVQTDPPGPGFGGGVFARFPSSVERCTLYGNSGGTPAGVGGLDLQEGGTVRQVIVARTAVGNACAGPIEWSCSTLFANFAGNAFCGTNAGGNSNADPLFCSDPLASDDVSIRSDSPCAPGASSCDAIGAGPVACEPQAVEARTWSAVKRTYR